MLKPEIQEALKALLPQAMQARAYVAGGYAQSPELAEDIDLWVVDQQAGDVDALRHHLFRSDFEVSMPSEDHIYSGSDSFLLLANVWIEVSVGKHQLLQKVQILISPVKTILELMNRFDITTHQVAVKLDNLQQYAASTWTAPALQPRVVAWDRPEVTLSRLLKIAQRYGHKPDERDVAKLERLSAERNSSEGFFPLVLNEMEVPF